MFRTIRRVMDKHPDVKAIYPIRMNPVVHETANAILGDDERIHIIEPLDVLDFHNFMARGYMILTDSGGIQEEAPSLGKHVLVMGDTTERLAEIAVRTYHRGDNLRRIQTIADRQDVYDAMAKTSSPYVDEHTCK